MDHRIRLAMKTGSFLKMSGEVEADETFIGGLAKNMHKGKRAEKIKGTGGAGKEAVLGIVQRGTDETANRIKTVHVPNVRRKTLAPEVRAAVEPGATVYTDVLKLYLGLSDTYTHETVDHAIEFVRGNVHTNNVENFWSLLMRTLKGAYTNRLRLRPMLPLPAPHAGRVREGVRLRKRSDLRALGLTSASIQHI